MFKNPATYSCQNGKYLAIITDDSAIIWNEAIESYKEETNCNEKNATCKMQHFYIFTYIFINYYGFIGSW